MLSVVVTLAIAVTAVGAARSVAPVRRAYARAAGGPYRTLTVAPRQLGSSSPVTLVIVGSATMSVAVIVALCGVLLTLRWEGIGVALLPAIAIAVTRLYAASLAIPASDLEPLRTVASAALLLDVPLFVFALLHVALNDVTGAHAPLSLADVAAGFALADALHSALVRTARSSP
ncbi:MAG TPA: hypothetical protein VGH28_25565 [Polyangiaceae bacterium]